MINLIKLISILLSLFLLSCAGGGGGGSSSSSSTFLDTGTSVSYNSSTASTYQNYDMYQNIKGSSQSSYGNPYDQINLYKAYGYGYSGDGKTIAILDSKFDVNHYAFQGGKTVSTYGTIDADTTSSYHGNTVASIAAGYLNTGLSTSVASHGVAFDADLHLSDYSNTSFNTYYADHWADATTNAKQWGAVVQNNSWGIDVEYNSATSYSSSGLATTFTNQGFTSNTTSIDNWISEMNSFQNQGVIVYALSNTSSFSDVDIQAGLPEIYTQLNEAWITAVNVDIQGSTYTRKSAPCGSTAAYCLGGDGWKINGAAYYTDNSYYITAGTQGTSFVAPQISGGVAIMAEAFPNQTPEQWTDRLLASADNSFFTASSTVSFANGITHGYNTEFGHGIMDLYAALRPITSSRMKESILVGKNLQDSSRYDLSNSFVSTPKSFGDSLSKHFNNKNAVFHDALYGNFNYDFGNSFIEAQDIYTSKQILDSHLNTYSINKNYFDDSFSIQSGFISKNKSKGNITELDPNSFTNFISYNGIDGYTSINMPLEVSTNFVSSDLSNSLIFSEGFNNPFIPKNNFSFGTSITHNDNLILSFYDDSHQNTVNPTAGLVVTKSLINKDDANSNIMIGYGSEKNGIIGANLSGAFEQNQQTPTLYLSHSFEKKFNNKSSLSVISSIGRTHFNNNYNETLINEISPIISSSFGIAFNHDINAKENLIIKFSQPHRLESGRANISVPQSNNLDGSLNYLNEDVNLSPSGRQFDLSLRYNKNILEDDLLLSFENITTTDQGHISSNEILNTSIVSINYNF
jgi:subtilase-type serine protease